MSTGNRARLKALVYFTLLAAFVGGCGEEKHPLFGCKGVDELLSSVVEEPRITLTPATLSTKLVPGSSLQVPIVVHFVGGPTQANLSLPRSLPPGVTATFSPVAVTDAITSTMTLVADSTATAGIFIYEIVATEAISNTPLTVRASMTGEVEVPFTLISPGFQSATVGTTRELTIVLERKPSFVAPVGLSVDMTTVPTGTVVSFAPPAATGLSSQLRLTIPAGAPTMPYAVTVRARYGASQQSANFNLSLQAAPLPPEITVIATPATRTVIPGERADYTLLFTRNEATIGMGSFTQAVSGLPNGATVTFTPTIPQSGTSTSMVIATTTATLDGTYPLTITATLGTLVKITSVNLVVATPPNFTMALSPAAITVNRGASADVTVTLQRTGPKSDITIEGQSLPTGVLIGTLPTVFNANTNSGNLKVVVLATAAPGTHTITVRGVSGMLTKTATLTLTIPAAPPSDVTIAVETPVTAVTSGGTAQVPIRLTRKGTAVGQLLELRSTGVPAGGYAWITPSSTTGDEATLNVIGGAAGEYNVAVSVVLGAFPPTDIAGIKVTASTAGDFSLLPAPMTLDAPIGASTEAAVQIGRTNGFVGPVSFMAFTDRPGDYQVTFSLNSTTGNGMGMTIHVNPEVPVGPHVLRIRGTSGNIVHEMSMTLNVTTDYNPYPYYPYGVKRPPN